MADATLAYEFENGPGVRLNLFNLFDAREPKISQAKFGEDFGIGTQGMVWQYMSGTRPLSIAGIIGPKP